MSNMETNQLLQHLKSLRIADTPRQCQFQNLKREIQSDMVKKTKVPATPCSGAPTFQTEVKKRRKMKFNRSYNYDTDQHFIKARKSLNF